MFSLSPLTITLPSRLDNNQPVIDLDLHLPFLCFRPQTLLQVTQKCLDIFPKKTKTLVNCVFLFQVLSCLLQEQQLVFFSSDFSKLTLISESLLIFLKVSSNVKRDAET